VPLVLALTVDAAKNAAIVILLGLLVLGVIVVRFTKTVASKAITLLVVAGVALGVWTQRASMADCASKVKDAAVGTGKPTTNCRFFGAEVDVSVPGR
jgi:hypothetical protein